MTTLDRLRVPATVDWSNRRVVQLLDAAGKCFARRGFAQTSIKDIAKKVGVTKSMVHYYFTSKDHLLHEVLSYTYQRHLERVIGQLHFEGEGALDRARQGLKSLWKTVLDQPNVIRLSIEFWSAAARDKKVRGQLSEIQRTTRELIAAGIEEALGEEAGRLPFKPEALAGLILAVLDGLMIQQYAEPEGLDVDQAFRIFLAAMMSGMAAIGIKQ